MPTSFFVDPSLNPPLHIWTPSERKAEPRFRKESNIHFFINRLPVQACILSWNTYIQANFFNALCIDYIFSCNQVANPSSAYSDQIVIGTPYFVFSRYCHFLY